MTTPSEATIADVLDGRVRDVSAFHGFGGLHGGLVAALLLRDARRRAGSVRTPIETTVHFLRPSLAAPELFGELMLDGRTTAVATSSASTDGTRTATATSVLGIPRTTVTPSVERSFPEGVAPLEQAKPFVIPPEFVPISSRMELRLATEAQPFSGRDLPRMSAWIRLTESVGDPFERLLLLADTLPPSYAAILTDLHQIPTVRLTARFTSAVTTTSFDWVLVSAETGEAGSDGWLSEDLGIWAEDGTLLATSTQLRAVR